MILWAVDGFAGITFARPLHATVLARILAEFGELSEQGLALLLDVADRSGRMAGRLSGTNEAVALASLAAECRGAVSVSQLYERMARYV